MLGVITSRDILTHPVVTIQCFGFRLFLKALFARPNETFLSVLSRAGALGNGGHPRPQAEVTERFSRMIQLELRAKKVYTTFAQTFASDATARRFFETLAAQEQEHADMLEIHRVATFRGDCKMNDDDCSNEALSRLEQEMSDAEELSTAIDSLEDALRLVVQLEWSEINQVFKDLFSASRSVFVQKLLKSEEEIDAHTSYVIEHVVELCPQILQTSPRLQTDCV
jgi:rubrerythrin